MRAYRHFYRFLNANTKRRHVEQNIDRARSAHSCKQNKWEIIESDKHIEIGKEPSNEFWVMAAKSRRRTGTRFVRRKRLLDISVTKIFYKRQMTIF